MLETAASMSYTILYQIIFSGQFSTHLSATSVRESLAALCGIPVTQADKLLDGRRYILKKNLTLSEAENYQQRFESRGLTLHIEAMPHEQQKMSQTQGQSATRLSYQLYFSGEHNTRVTLDGAQRNFMQLFGINVEQMMLYFDGETHLIKDKLSKADALRYQAYLSQHGLIVSIKPVGGLMQSNTEHAQDNDEDIKLLPSDSELFAETAPDWKMQKKQESVLPRQVLTTEVAPSDDLYQVVFRGEYSRPEMPAKIYERFIAVYGGHIEEIKLLFNGEPQILSAYLNRVQAEQYANPFFDAGFKVYLEVMPEVVLIEESEALPFEWFNFSGRLDRLQFVYCVLLLTGVSAILSLLLNSFGLERISAFLALPVFFLQLSFYVRRLHDANFSGWWVIAVFFMYIWGAVALMNFVTVLLPIGIMCLFPTHKDNAYGPATAPFTPTYASWVIAGGACILLIDSWYVYHRTSTYDRREPESSALQQRAMDYQQTPDRARKQLEQALEEAAKAKEEQMKEL